MVGVGVWEEGSSVGALLLGPKGSPVLSEDPNDDDEDDDDGNDEMSSKKN